MNANKRMKYASTPTYGMQKRGFSKKAASAQPSPTPDFTQPPAMSGNAVPFVQAPLSPMMPSVYPPAASAAPAPFIPQAMPSAFALPGPSLSQAAQPKMGAGFFQPAQTSPAAPMTLPLGNAPFAMPAQNSFAPRQQGFMPQAPAPQGSAMPGGFPQPAFEPQARPPFSPSPAFGGQAFPAQQTPAFAPQAAAPNLMQPFPGTATPQSPAQAPMLPQQQNAFSAHPNMQSPSGQTSMRDPLWMGLLFGLLPALFVLCLFVPSSFDLVRYGFIVLCVFGLGAMWYRQMFTSNTRATISIIYAALCIVVVSFLLNGTADVKETNAEDLSGGMSMQTTVPPDDSLSAAAAAQPEETPTPTPAAVSAAEERLIAFMNIWAYNREASEMVSLVQPSWASSKENPTAELFALLTNRTPESYVIEEVGGSDADTSRTITMSAYINKNNGKNATRYRFTVMMVKEGGEWYVDPNTLSSTEAIKEAAKEGTQAEATATESISMTLPPRMTETPVPPPNTLLYFNPNGGSLYHADQYCKRVDDKYLPLEGTFPYSELGSVLDQGKLEPCLDCRAPTNAVSSEE